MNIGILGWWHNDNQGDTRILENTTRALAPSRIVPIDLPFPMTEDSLRRLNLLDFLVLGGGGLFQNTPPPPFDSFDVWEKHLQTPIGVAGVGIDGIVPEYRRAVLTLAERARFFYVRDLVSQQIVGHPAVQTIPDLSFLYPLENALGMKALTQDASVCGVNLRQTPGLDVEPWIRVLQGLPLRFRAMPMSTFGVWEEGRILRQLDEGFSMPFDPASYNDLDLMVGTAFHSVAFAIQATVPVIAIAYASKVRRLMTDIGLERYILEPDESSRLPQLVESALDEREQLVGHLQETTKELTSAAWLGMADITEEIGKTARQHTSSASRVSIVVLGSTSEAANQATVKSCLDQTHENVEVIVVGDSDQPLAVIPPASTEVSAVTGSRDESVGKRLNRAFARATGEYLSWLEAGNLYARDALSCMIDRVERESACDMVYADHYQIQEPARIVGVFSVDSAYKLIRRNVVGPCFLYRRRLSEVVGPFGSDTALPPYDYWLRAHTNLGLQPMHVRLFYERTLHGEAHESEAERQVRRQWRSMSPWFLRSFWRVIDTTTAERLIVTPLLDTLRNTRFLLCQLGYRKREGGLTNDD